MADVKYKPLNAAITVLLPSVSKETKGGIIKSEEMLREEMKKFTGALKVIHTGPTIPLTVEGEPQIKPGDKVLLRNGAELTELNIGGLNLQQVDAYHVLGVIG